MDIHTSRAGKEAKSPESVSLSKKTSTCLGKALMKAAPLLDIPMVPLDVIINEERKRREKRKQPGGERPTVQIDDDAPSPDEKDPGNESEEVRIEVLL